MSEGTAQKNYSAQVLAQQPLQQRPRWQAVVGGAARNAGIPSGTAWGRWGSFPTRPAEGALRTPDASDEPNMAECLRNRDRSSR